MKGHWGLVNMAVLPRKIVDRRLLLLGDEGMCKSNGATCAECYRHSSPLTVVVLLNALLFPLIIDFECINMWFEQTSKVEVKAVNYVCCMDFDVDSV